MINEDIKKFAEFLDYFHDKYETGAENFNTSSGR